MARACYAVASAHCGMGPRALNARALAAAHRGQAARNYGGTKKRCSGCREGGYFADELCFGKMSRSAGTIDFVGRSREGLETD